MRTFVILAALLVPGLTSAQIKDVRLFIGGGVALHGTGDMRGV